MCMFIYLYVCVYTDAHITSHARLLAENLYQVLLIALGEITLRNFKCNTFLVCTEAALHSVESHWRGSPHMCVPPTAYQAPLRCQECKGLLFAQLKRGQGLPVPGGTP